MVPVGDGELVKQVALVDSVDLNAVDTGLTQQLAKQLYSEKAGSTMERLLQKPIEWVIAVKLNSISSSPSALLPVGFLSRARQTNCRLG